jgi:hypothetical protein
MGTGTRKTRAQEGMKRKAMESVGKGKQQKV